jgi:hemerythrin-like domain-containing protein
LNDDDLATRAGLSDAVAWQRGDYPGAEWRAHRNFGQLADFWLHIHATLRGEGAHVAAAVEGFRAGRSDPAGFQRAFVHRINQFLQHLTAHHTIEDQAYFPKFRALDPRMTAGFDLLENDHGAIHVALETSVDSARAMLAALDGDRDGRRRAVDRYATDHDRLVALLTQHLADEEDLVLPALLHFGERSVS